MVRNPKSCRKWFIANVKSWWRNGTHQRCIVQPLVCQLVIVLSFHFHRQLTGMYLNECENLHLNCWRCLCPRAYCACKLNMDKRMNENVQIAREEFVHYVHAGDENNLYQWSVSIYTIINSSGHREVAPHNFVCMKTHRSPRRVCLAYQCQLIY